KEFALKTSVGAGLGIGAASAALNAPSVAIAPTSPAIFLPMFSSSSVAGRITGSLQRCYLAMVPAAILCLFQADNELMGRRVPRPASRIAAANEQPAPAAPAAPSGRRRRSDDSRACG